MTYPYTWDRYGEKIIRSREVSLGSLHSKGEYACKLNIIFNTIVAYVGNL